MEFRDDTRQASGQGEELALPRLRPELFLISLVFEPVLMSSIGCFGLHL